MFPLSRTSGAVRVCVSGLILCGCQFPFGGSRTETGNGAGKSFEAVGEVPSASDPSATAVPTDTLDCSPFDRNRGDGMAEFECRFRDPAGMPTPKARLVSRVTAGLLSGREEKVEFELVSLSESGAVVFIRYPVLSFDLVSKFDFFLKEENAAPADAKANSQPPLSFVITDSGRSLALSNDAFSLSVDLTRCASAGYSAMRNVGNSGEVRCLDGSLVTLISEDNSSGRSAAIACCPLETPELLISQKGENRAQSCGPDEVMIGIANLAENLLVCAKLDPKKAVLGEEYAAIFIPGEPSAAELVKFPAPTGSHVPPMAAAASELVSSMSALAQGFSGRDTTACSPNSFMTSRAKQLVQVGDISVPVILPVCRSLAPVKR
jgi:hypothetical protein